MFAAFLIFSKKRKRKSRRGREILLDCASDHQQKVQKEISYNLIFAKHIEPSSWSGNMSDILRIRKPVFINLSTHCNPIVSVWAKEVSELIEERILIWENSEFEQNKEKVYPFEP